jgi:hypothetical protein
MTSNQETTMSEQPWYPGPLSESGITASPSAMQARRELDALAPEMAAFVLDIHYEVCGCDDGSGTDPACLLADKLRGIGGKA